MQTNFEYELRMASERGLCKHFRTPEGCNNKSCSLIHSNHKICSHWITSGKHSMRDCKFLHPKVCRDWASGNCQFGAKCFYFHPQGTENKENNHQISNYHRRSNSLSLNQDYSTKEVIQTKVIKVEQEVKGKDYIFVVDSSGSMYGQKFEDLKVALKNAIDEVGKANPNNRVSVINFSSDAEKSCSYHQDPKKLKFSLELKQLGGGTNFGKAISASLEAMQSLTSKHFVLIFMSDGIASYPETEISEMKSWLEKSGRKLEFFMIGFECRTKILSQMCCALGGTEFQGIKADELKATYITIIKKTVTCVLNHRRH